MEKNKVTNSGKKIVQVISIDSIKSEQRVRLNYGDVADLAQNIKEHGLIQPIAVMETKEGYRLLAGGRRLIACINLDMDKIPARIYPTGTTEIQAKEIELMENLARLDLSFQERAMLEHSIHKLKVAAAGGEKIGRRPDSPGHSLRDTAKLLDKSHYSVTSHINMAKLMEQDPDLKKAIMSCKTEKEAKKVLRQVTQRVNREERAIEVESQDQPLIHTILFGSFVIRDAFEGMDELIEQDEHFDLIEVDPPYGVDLKNTKKKNIETGADISLIQYHEIKSSEYNEFLKDLISRCVKLQKDGSWLVFWFAIQNYDIVKKCLLENGYSFWHIPSIWVKPSGQTQQPTMHLASCYETFIYARCGDARLAKAGRSNVFSFRGVSPVGSGLKKKQHPAERPIELMQEIISTFVDPGKGGNILVPFLGSGNTLLAAANLGLSGIGFELESSYRDLFIERVAASSPPNYVSY